MAIVTTSVTGPRCRVHASMTAAAGRTLLEWLMSSRVLITKYWFLLSRQYAFMWGMNLDQAFLE
jgi:hypothetical protein